MSALSLIAAGLVSMELGDSQVVSHADMGGFSHATSVTTISIPALSIPALGIPALWAISSLVMFAMSVAFLIWPSRKPPRIG